jgi:hypothetical protein
VGDDLLAHLAFGASPLLLHGFAGHADVFMTDRD